MDKIEFNYYDAENPIEIKVTVKELQCINVFKGLVQFLRAVGYPDSVIQATLDKLYEEGIDTI